MTVAELVSPRRSARLVRARHTAFWLARAAGYSFPQIGRAFGDRDHTTVMHGVLRARDYAVHDLDFLAGLTALAAVFSCSVPASTEAT